MTEKRENSVHVKLSDDADKALELLVITQSGGTTKAAIAASLLERGLLGEAHAIRMALARLSRQGSSGRPVE